MSSLDGAGSVLGVQGVVAAPVTGSFTVDESQAFIGGTTGVHSSGLMGGTGVLQVTLGGSTFSCNIDQMVVYQQFSPGVNVVSAFSIAFNVLLDGAVQTFPRASLAVQFAFPSAGGFAPGALTGLGGPDLGHPQSFGVLLENAGNSPENAVRFTFDSFSSVPAPGAAWVTACAGAACLRRRRRQGRQTPGLGIVARPQARHDGSALLCAPRSRP